ncbi:MAG: phosphoribosylamine--glycine ligase [Coriobacteriales bacterium]|jgi:phosphoribosylamine--glycine ligase|nr:phosphoribosylamine--glycine ligase [Coriobacteriales bacterium]
MSLPNTPLDVLIIGAGGREHAITRALLASPDCGRVYVAPGNGGTAIDALNVALAVNDGSAVAAFARQNGVRLVVVGPEEPLVKGVADAVRAEGIACFGPSAVAAQIEGSKRFAKQFMDAHSLPTAAWGYFNDSYSALEFLYQHEAPIVVKADGLAAGKGVTVATSLAEAEAAVKECLDGRFGEAGATVLIEEALSGPECSLLVFTDGQRILPMAPAQDHKRAGEGDTGPNTGGMGVYSPVPIVSEPEHARMLEIMEQAINGFISDGIDYRGVLYGGFMLTAEGPKLLEFNARFGDPETQVLLPRLNSDLLEVLYKAAVGDLGAMQLDWSSDWAVSVVLASAGYPGSYQTGHAISGIAAAEALPGITVYHAGTAIDEHSQLVTAGGRVLNVTAQAASFKAAQELAYQAVDKIDFSGKQYRRDIGSRALMGRAAWD